MRRPRLSPGRRGLRSLCRDTVRNLMPPHPVPDRPHLPDVGLSPLVSRRPLDAAVLGTDPLDALTAALAPVFRIVVHVLLLSVDSALRRPDRDWERHLARLPKNCIAKAGAIPAPVFYVDAV